jgi:hypothetical protein
MGLFQAYFSFFLKVREIADQFYHTGELRWQVGALMALQEVCFYFYYTL